MYRAGSRRRLIVAGASAITDLVVGVAAVHVGQQPVVGLQDVQPLASHAAGAGDLIGQRRRADLRTCRHVRGALHRRQRHARGLVGGNADSRVAHGNLERLAAALAADVHAALVRVADCVGDQISENAIHPSGINTCRHRLNRRVNLHL